MKDGAHTHGHGGGPGDPGPVIVAFVIAALALAVFEWVAARPWWQLALAAIILVLAAAGVLRMRRADLAQLAAAGRAIRAEAARQAVQETVPPAIEQHVHYHYHAVDGGPKAARVIRQAVTNTQLPPGGQD